MQIAIKPAKPFAFGRLDGVPIFGLPGNPVSSMVSYELLAKPALRTMSGRREPGPVMVRARSVDSLSHPPDGKTHFVRVKGTPGEDGVWQVSRSGGQGSHQLTAMARADALAVVPDGTRFEPGDLLDIIVLDGLR
jgi:molybdopterin biosynthesis enzyme